MSAPDPKRTPYVNQWTSLGKLVPTEFSPMLGLSQMAFPANGPAEGVKNPPKWDSGLFHAYRQDGDEEREGPHGPFGVVY